MALGLFMAACCFAYSAAPPRAMWVYETDALLNSPTARTELFAFCAPRQITDLFFQTHFDRKSQEPLIYTLRHPAETEAFLKEANAHHVHIHALGGDPWDVLPKNHDRTLARVDAFLTFNQAAAADSRFAGLHLDIEPHGLPQWKSADNAEKCRLLTLMVELNRKIADKLHTQAPGVLYGADITFWFDKENADGTPSYPVTFHGVTKDATKHLLDLADNVGIMSYRDSAEGRNGLIALVQRTIDYADHAHGRAFVGVKMANIGPQHESFFGHTEAEMNKELHKVDDAYQAHRGYAGLAYFMYSAYKAMPH